MGGVARHGATGHGWRGTAVRLCWRHRRSKMKGEIFKMKWLVQLVGAALVARKSSGMAGEGWEVGARVG